VTVIDVLSDASRWEAFGSSAVVGAADEGEECREVDTVLLITVTTEERRHAA
jgi:hypothetical protein